MLNKNRISGIKILTDEWKVTRLGKFTSSGIHNIMQAKPCTDGFMSHIYEKVGEEMTGKPAGGDFDFETDQMRWGAHNEAKALTKFGQIKGIDFLIVQQLITVPDTRYGSTPDGLIVFNESTDENFYNVSTVEVKCFPTYARYIPLMLCETPEEIKVENPPLYWQVLDQMDNCDCLTGFSVMYHPDFRAGDIGIVEFRKIALWKDFQFLKERKQLATQKFEEVRDKILNKKLNHVRPI